MRAGFQGQKQWLGEEHSIKVSTVGIQVLTRFKSVVMGVEWSFKSFH